MHLILLGEKRVLYQVTPDEGGESTPAFFLLREDPITNKLAVGRHRDLADVEAIDDAGNAVGAKLKGRKRILPQPRPLP